jgi:DNA-binding transcriptional regulator/RsmH inhibitor MraZ
MNTAMEPRARRGSVIPSSTPRLISLVVLLVAASPVLAQQEALFPIHKDGKWGYIDRSGRVLIPPRFESAARFSEGLAAVVLEGRPAYIDGSGRTILVPDAEPAGTTHRKFADGLAAVRKGRKIGFIDRSGRLVIPATFTTAEDFSEGLAYACGAVGCGYIDRAGRGVVGPGLLGGMPFRGGVAGVVVGKGAMGGKSYALHDRELGRLTGEWENVGSLSEGLIAVRTQGRWGYVDRRGRGVIRPQYAGGGEFSEGLAPVAEQAWTCGYLDRAGRVVVPARFRLCYPFSNGLARVEVLGPDPKHPLPGFIDRTGKLVIEGARATPPFESADDFIDGLAAVETPGPSGTKRLGYIDGTGRYVWSPTE